jgi:hypothetical protein
MCAAFESRTRLGLRVFRPVFEPPTTPRPRLREPPNKAALHMHACRFINYLRRSFTALDKQNTNAGEYRRTKMMRDIPLRVMYRLSFNHRLRNALKSILV